jgi:hypothetical protein
MAQRHLFFCALLLAALGQAVFVVTYAIVTEGCFCAITGVGQPVPSDGLVWIVLVGSLPLRTLPVHLPFSVGGWGTALMFAALNSLFWLSGFWALLNGIALLGRIHLRRSVDGTLAPHLRALGAVQAGWVATGMIGLLGFGLGSSAVYRRAWLAEAEERVRVTVDAVQQGHDLPYSYYGVDCYPGECPVMASAGEYVLERKERYTVGLRALELFAPPRSWSGEARFENGARYRLDAFESDREWEVFVSLTAKPSAAPNAKRN